MTITEDGTTKTITTENCGESPCKASSEAPSDAITYTLISTITISTDGTVKTLTTTECDLTSTSANHLPSASRDKEKTKTTKCSGEKCKVPTHSAGSPSVPADSPNTPAHQKTTKTTQCSGPDCQLPTAPNKPGLSTAVITTSYTNGKVETSTKVECNGSPCKPDGFTSVPSVPQVRPSQTTGEIQPYAGSASRATDSILLLVV